MNNRSAVMLFSLACMVVVPLMPRVVIAASERQGCGRLANAYGPYDYNDPANRGHRLHIVEHYHFTESVRTLQPGVPGIPQNLDYTLRAFPNHPQALYAMARWQLAHGDHAGPHYLTAECYFKRAIEFRPRDGVVWMIYGIFLQRKGQLKKALQKYLHAKNLIPKSPELDYNLGLLYVRLKDYGKARRYAELAYNAGYPLPGLKKQLKAVGAWTHNR